MIALALLLQASAAVPTVGDTIWLARTVPVPPGYTVRAPEDSLGGAVELLGPVEVVQQGRAVLLRYPSVAWEPGRHTVALPGPVLVGSDGTVDSVPPLEVTVTVASVLPEVPRDSSLPIQPPSGLVGRRERAWLPAVVFPVVALALLAPVHWWWRRRGTPVPLRHAVDHASEVPAERWAAAGERRAVLTAAAGRLRAAVHAQVPDAHPALDADGLAAVVAQQAPDLPARDIGDLLRRIDDARFGPLAAADAAALSHEAAALADGLSARPRTGSVA